MMEYAGGVAVADVHVLMGGGVDSAAVVDFYLARGDTVHGLHFDYGQAVAIGEWRAVVQLGQHFGIPVSTQSLMPELVSQGGQCRSRNAIFVLAAAAMYETQTMRIALGIHAGTEYYDCSFRFVETIQALLDGYFGGSVRIEAPLLYMSKATVFEYCRIRNVPVEITHSCLNQNYRGCGECPKCLERRKYYAL